MWFLQSFMVSRFSNTIQWFLICCNGNSANEFNRFRWDCAQHSKKKKKKRKPQTYWMKNMDHFNQALVRASYRSLLFSDRGGQQPVQDREMKVESTTWLRGTCGQQNVGKCYLKCPSPRSWLTICKEMRGLGQDVEQCTTYFFERILPLPFKNVIWPRDIVDWQASSSSLRHRDGWQVRDLSQWVLRPNCEWSWVKEKELRLWDGKGQGEW